MEFAAGLPSWMGGDGFPLSWHHFQYGLGYIRRKSARDQLALAAAVRTASAKDEDYRSWRREMNMTAGYEST